MCVGVYSIDHLPILIFKTLTFIPTIRIAVWLMENKRILYFAKPNSSQAIRLLQNKVHLNPTKMEEIPISLSMLITNMDITWNIKKNIHTCGVYDDFCC